MPDVVSMAEWIEARRVLLTKEKELTRLRDEVARQRRDLPWVRVEKAYAFEGTGGTKSLGDLFAGRSQLIVYHFMFDPTWEAGCKSCAFVTDHFDAAVPHLNARDVTLVVVSRAPLATLQAFRARMGWKFEWLSSHDSDFNYDYDVSFTPEQEQSGEIRYNFRPTQYFASEGPGISVFAKDGDEIFHTYSSYSRGLDLLIGAYNLIDLTPKGRQEEGLPFAMAWVRHHDSYDESSVSP